MFHKDEQVSQLQERIDNARSSLLDAVEHLKLATQILKEKEEKQVVGTTKQQRD